MLNSFKLPFFTALLGCLLLSTGLSAQAEIYSWKDENGNTVYSDQKTSEKAKATQPSDKNVNYYSAPKAKEQPAKLIEKAYDTLATLEEAGDETKGEEALTEKQCQQQYQRSCDQVNNWQKYAKEACGSDSRCKDPEFLDRKYRPRTVEELLEVARRAGVRKNNMEDEISTFLKKKYSNHCESNGKAYCRQNPGNNCTARAEARCGDSRSLAQVLAKYDSLSPYEKQQIVEEAKKIAQANGKDPLNMDQMLSSLLDILISQAVLGI